MSATNSDVLSRIHCGYEQFKPFHRTKPDGELKPERRVRFPDDEVISDYLEPFRPVPDNCTSEELIAAYIDSCLHYKVQPIEFLLEQLKGIDLSICNERYSRLSLKGLRLNRLQVETLEEIFRRVHFRELDFENTYLDDQSAVALFDMLLHYETCNELNITLRLDKFHPSQAWARCVTFLRRSCELRRFALSNTPLTISNFLGMSFFGLSLDCLSLRNCNISGEVLYGLVRWLRLLLSSTSFDPPGKEKTSSCVHSGRRSGRTASRNTRRSRLANDTEKSATSVLPVPIWNLKLDVSHNKLNASDAETMLTLIRHQLLVPDLFSSRLETSQEAAEISESSQTTRKDLLPVGGIGFLEHLDISNNQLGDDGLRVICTGLLQSYRTRLRRLHSASGTVTGEEASDDAFVTCSTGDSAQSPPSYNASDKTAFHIRGLEHLSVGNNGLTSSGMQSIALVLMQAPSTLVSLVGGLVSLDLSHNPNIRDTGVEILCDGLMRNHSLKSLNLKAVNMSFSGIFALSGFLSESKHLHYLDIRMNSMNVASLMALSKTLVINYTLVTLLSDARNLSSSTDPLHASDAELTLFLIDEIDSCLRRNRILAVGSQHPSSTVTNSQLDAHLSSSTYLPTAPLASNSKRREVQLPTAISLDDKVFDESLRTAKSTRNATVMKRCRTTVTEHSESFDATVTEGHAMFHSVILPPKMTNATPYELVNREYTRASSLNNLQVPCTIIGEPRKECPSVYPDQSTNLLLEVPLTEVGSPTALTTSDAEATFGADIDTFYHPTEFEIKSVELLHM